MDNFIMPFLGHTITLTQHQEDQEQQQQLTPEDVTEEASGPTWNLQPLSITKSSNGSSSSTTTSSSSSSSSAVASGTGMKVSWECTRGGWAIHNKRYVSGLCYGTGSCGMNSRL
jgi:hypothetical protein